MNTRMLSADCEADLVLAAELLSKGELVGIPTETVYGLAANGLDEKAVEKIFEAKGRPQDNPLILHIAQAEEMCRLCRDIPESAWLLARHFWPGPLTMVLPVQDIVPKRTTANLDTVAVRCPKTPATRKLITLAGVPIAAPSANRSGKPSTTTADHVLTDMEGRIAAILDGGPCEFGVESTIVDLTGARPRLLRPGGISPEDLIALLGELEIDKAVTAQLSAHEIVRAPGMKYKHYAPQAQVIIVKGGDEDAARYIHAHWQPNTAVMCFREELFLYEGKRALAYGSRADEKSLSAGLFAALRALDTPEIQTIYARCPEDKGVAYAVANRLRKAAGFYTIEVTP